MEGVKSIPLPRGQRSLLDRRQQGRGTASGALIDVQKRGGISRRPVGSLGGRWPCDRVGMRMKIVSLAHPCSALSLLLLLLLLVSERSQRSDHPDMV